MSRFAVNTRARSALASACAAMALCAGIAMLPAWRATPSPVACTTDAHCQSVARALGIAGGYHDAPLGWLARDCDAGNAQACEALANARTYRSWLENARKAPIAGPR